MNGKFSVICGNDGAKIRLTPPTDGGEPISMSAIVDYLNYNKIDFQLPEVNKAVQELQKEIILPLNRIRCMPIRENFTHELRENNMECVAKFMPPSEKGERYDLNEIIDDLKFKGVKFGIDKKAIMEFLDSRDYSKEYVVARGVEAKQGKSATIEYTFNTDVKARPTLLEDGSVDFFSLNIINHVSEGDLLATLYREVPGQYGCDVTGVKIKPARVRKRVLRFGKNIRLSEDKNQIFATCDGHVNLVDGRVFVSNVMQVENVDTSTGNIDYDGNVQVNGNVATNFSIHAKGNVEVRGVVEGAEITAGGNITIARGMNGMSRGVLKAGGNIISQFIENSTVEATGYVEAGSIMHSTVLAGTEVHVGGKRGFISGGKVCATTVVEAKILGSDMGTDTLIEIGISPTVKRRHKELEALLDANEKTINRAIPILEAARDKSAAGITLSAEQIDNIRGLAAIVKDKAREQRELQEELKEITLLLSDEHRASVTVRDVVHQGVKINISDVSKIIKEPVRYCRFIKDRGDVRVVGIN